MYQVDQSMLSMLCQLFKRVWDVLDCKQIIKVKHLFGLKYNTQLRLDYLKIRNVPGVQHLCRYITEEVP